MQTHQDLWFSARDQLEHIFFRETHSPYPVLDFLPWPIRVTGIEFPDGSQQFTAGGGGGGGGPALIAGTGISLTPGVGTLTIANTAPAVAANPGGAIQFNSGGAFAASPNLTWDIANNTLSLRSAVGDMAVFLGTTTANQWVRIGNAAAAMDLGVGTVAPTAGVPYIWGSSDRFFIGADGQPVVFINGMNGSTAQVGIGTATPAHRLDVAGNVNITDPGGTSGYAFRVNGAAIGAALAVVNATAPASPVMGTLWYNMTTFRLMIWLGSWVQV